MCVCIFIFAWTLYSVYFVTSFSYLPCANLLSSEFWLLCAMRTFAYLISSLVLVIVYSETSKNTLGELFLSFVRRLSSLGGAKCTRTIGRKYFVTSSHVFCRDVYYTVSLFGRVHHRRSPCSCKGHHCSLLIYEQCTAYSIGRNDNIDNFKILSFVKLQSCECSACMVSCDPFV